MTWVAEEHNLGIDQSNTRSISTGHRSYGTECKAYGFCYRNRGPWLSDVVSNVCEKVARNGNREATRRKTSQATCKMPHALVLPICASNAKRNSICNYKRQVYFVYICTVSCTLTLLNLKDETGLDVFWNLKFINIFLDLWLFMDIHKNFGSFDNLKGLR